MLVSNISVTKKVMVMVKKSFLEYFHAFQKSRISIRLVMPTQMMALKAAYGM